MHVLKRNRTIVPVGDIIGFQICLEPARRLPSERKAANKIFVATIAVDGRDAGLNLIIFLDVIILRRNPDAERIAERA